MHLLDFSFFFPPHIRPGASFLVFFLILLFVLLPFLSDAQCVFFFASRFRLRRFSPFGWVRLQGRKKKKKSVVSFPLHPRAGKLWSTATPFRGEGKAPTKVTDQRRQRKKDKRKGTSSLGPNWNQIGEKHIPLNPLFYISALRRSKQPPWNLVPDSKMPVPCSESTDPSGTMCKTNRGEKKRKRHCTTPTCLGKQTRNRGGGEESCPRSLQRWHAQSAWCDDMPRPPSSTPFPCI